ncbi:hypothetical protein SCHAM137S_01964 [Streptomyces chartreusis]
MALNNLSLINAKAGNDAESQASAEEAVAIRRRLAQNNPDLYLNDLATSLLNLGAALADTRQWASAVDHTREALDIRRQLCEVDPLAYLYDFRLTARNLTGMLLFSRRWREAMRTRQENRRFVRKIRGAFRAARRRQRSRLNPRPQGALLVGAEEPADEFYRGRVMLVLWWDEMGALVVVLNHPTPVSLADVAAPDISQWETLAAAPPVVFEGGPDEVAPAICGAAAGTVVGARIQAHGGHAQAQAARDAADTAAQSARQQDLHDLRWATLTALLRAAAECMEATEHLFISSQARADAERAEIERAHHTFRLVYAEAELATPPGLELALRHMNSAVMGAYQAGKTRAPTERALRALEELTQEGDPAAVRAKESLIRLRAAGAPLWSPYRGSPPPEYAEVIEALYEVPRLDRSQVRLLLGSAAVPHEFELNPHDNVRGARQEWAERRNAYQDARRELIAAAREAMSTDEA